MSGRLRSCLSWAVVAGLLCGAWPASSWAALSERAPERTASAPLPVSLGAPEAPSLPRSEIPDASVEELPEALQRVKDFYRPAAAAAVAGPEAAGVAAEAAADPAAQAGGAEAAQAQPQTPRDKIVAKFKVRVQSWLMPHNLAWYGLTSMGQHWALKRLIRQQLNELHRPGDSPVYKVSILPSYQPNMAIDPEKAHLYVFTGLLPFAKNRDQWAGVVAHEMTHQNKGFLKAATDDPEVTRMLNGLEGYKDLPAAQREEIRADIGATARLIDAGHNPWAYYEFMKTLTRFQARLVDMRIIKFLFKIFFRKSFDYWEAHPAGEVRMKAIKGYLLYRRFEQDLSPVEGKFQPFPLVVRLMRWRMLPFSFLLLSPIMWIVQLAPDVVALVIKIIGHFSSRAAAAVSHGWDATTGVLGRGWDAGWGAVGSVTHPVRSFLAHRVIGPLWDHSLGWPWSHWVRPGFEAGWRFLGRTNLPPQMLIVMAAMFGFCGFMFWRLYRSDDLLPELRAARRNLRVVRNLAGRRDDALRLRLLVQTVGHLQKVQDIYADEAGVLRMLRWFDGLTLARLRWSALYRDLLGDLAERLEAAPAAERAALLSSYAPVLAKTPPFVFENARMRASLEEALSAAGAPESAYPERLRLLRRAQAPAGDASVPETLALARKLAEAGLLDTARRVIRPRRIRRELFSSGDPQAVEDFIAVRKLLREKRTMGMVGWTAGFLMDARLLLWQVSALWSPLPRALGLAALGRRLPARSMWVRPWQWLLGLLLRPVLRLRLSLGFSSVTGLSSYLRADAAAVPLDALSVDLYRVIRRHPQWLSSQADLDALLAGDFFWPKFGGSSPGFLESMLVEAVEGFAKRYPDQWRYEPGASEKLQALYLTALDRLGDRPQDLAGREALWKALTDRGVTSLTDEMFASLYNASPESDKTRLEDLALAGRLWDQPLKAKIVERRMSAWPAYRALLSETDAAKRKALLSGVIEELKRGYPERGIYFDAALEKLSRDIRSTMDESGMIEDAALPQGGERAEDFGLRVLSHMLDSALGWRKRQQWNLILFLRGDKKPTWRIRRAFRVVGPERIRRMYQIMPPLARTELLDQFIDSPRGLAGRLSLSSGYGRKIIDHVLPGDDLEARRTAYEILDAFLYSLKKTTGSSGMQSEVLAYMLAMPKDEAGSFGQTLKGVLELFGATGVKIGQLLAASGLLPEEEAKHLRQLQERAREPRREQMYQDLRRITGRRDQAFTVEDLLGSASVKYGFSARENETRQRLFIKIFRASAIANTPTEFAILDTMSTRLYDKHGAKYGVFRSLVKASRKAVERELSAPHEVERSKIARERVYAGASDESWAVDVPRETVVFPRMIASEFAPGVSVFDESLSPEERAAAAGKILDTEGPIYLQEKSSPDEAFEFDPDRHGGNNRVAPKRLSPIDHGQGQPLTGRQRAQIFDLFALAQVLKETGPTGWSDAELARIMGEPVTQKLRRALGKYFPKPDLDHTASYYSLLAALGEARGDLGIGYFDYVRGIIQLGQYDKLVTAGYGETPRQAFERIVRAKAEAYRDSLTLTTGEKLRIGLWRAIWRATRSLRLDEAWRRWWLFSTRPATRAAALALVIAATGARISMIPPVHAFLAQKEAAIAEKVELNFGHTQGDYEYRLLRDIKGKDEEWAADYLQGVVRESHGNFEKLNATEALLENLASRSDRALEIIAENLMTDEEMKSGLTGPNQFEGVQRKFLSLASPGTWDRKFLLPSEYVRRLNCLATDGKTPEIRKAAFELIVGWVRAGLEHEGNMYAVHNSQIWDKDPELRRWARAYFGEKDQTAGDIILAHTKAQDDIARSLSLDLVHIGGQFDEVASRHLWQLYMEKAVTPEELVSAYKVVLENMDIRKLGPVEWNLGDQLEGAVWRDGAYHLGTGSGANSLDLARAKEAAQAFLPLFVKMLDSKDRYDRGAMAIDEYMRAGYLTKEQAIGLLRASAARSPDGRSWLLLRADGLEREDTSKVDASKPLKLP